MQSESKASFSFLKLFPSASKSACARKKNGEFRATGGQIFHLYAAALDLEYSRNERKPESVTLGFMRGVALVEASDRHDAMYTFNQQYAGQYHTVESCTKLLG